MNQNFYSRRLNLFTIAFCTFSRILSVYTIFFLLFPFITYSNLGAMKTYAFCLDLFAKDYEKTEYYSYLELIKNPLPIKVNYLAIPWLGASSTKDIKRIEQELNGLHLDGGFTILYGFSEIKENPIINILKRVGIDCIFTPRASSKCGVVNGIKIISYPYNALNGVNPSPIKDILYSYIGFSSHPIRKILCTMNHPPQTIVKETHKWISQEGRNEFKNVLARSRFSLCPRGFAPNSIRFWESLQAGAIPILISDTALLPEGFDWNSCCIRVSEKDISQIQYIIGQISPDREREMRQACLVAHSMFSGKNLISPIDRFYLTQSKKCINSTIPDLKTNISCAPNQENDFTSVQWQLLQELSATMVGLEYTFD